MRLRSRRSRRWRDGVTGPARLYRDRARPRSTSNAGKLGPAMKTTTTIAALLVCPIALGCEESKTDKPSPAATASTSAASSLPPMPSSLPTAAPSASVTWVKKVAADCKPHPTTIDFGDDTALEKEVR